MRHRFLILVAGLLAFVVSPARADEPKKPPKTVEELYPLYATPDAPWQHYADPRVLQTFQFGKYISSNPKAPPKYHIGLVFQYVEKPTADTPRGYYGAADKVEATADGGLKVSLPATKTSPKRDVLLKRVGDKLELRLPDGPGKGTYTLERAPKLPNLKTVRADYQQSWGDDTKKQPLAFFMFYPYIEADKTGRPGIRYYITLTPAKDDSAKPQAYDGPATAVEEVKGGALKVTLPPATKGGPARELALTRDGDALTVKVADGPLKGVSRLTKSPAFNPRTLYPDYQKEWRIAGKDQALTFFQFGTYFVGDGRPVVRFHVGLNFKGDDSSANFYGQAEQVERDPKTGGLKVTLPPREKGGPVRTVLLKRVGDGLEVTLPDGKFKGTYKLNPAPPPKK